MNELVQLGNDLTRKRGLSLILTQNSARTSKTDLIAHLILNGPLFVISGDEWLPAFEHPTLSFNTIYINLMSFAEKGVILKINVLHESARFGGDSSPHHHFVCVRCKKFVDLHNIRVPKITIPKELGAATIFHHQLRLNGICEKCEGKGTVSDRKPRKTQRVSLHA